MPPKSSSKSSPKRAKGLTKSQLLAEVASAAGATKSAAADIISALSEVVSAELKKGRPITVPNIAKLTLQRKPATPARAGINPFTKEPTTFKAKPARNVVKARPVKALKEAV